MRQVIRFSFGLIVAAALAGCNQPASNDSQTSNPPATKTGAAAPGKKITICFLPKKKGLSFFTSCAKGAQEAADELGDVDLIYDGPTDGSPEKAASMIDQWTLKGVDVIAVSPNDPDVLAPAMKKARAKGIHVVTWDADGKPDTRELFVSQATPQSIGFTLVDALAKDIGGAQPTGKVAIITASLTAANQNEWMKHMKTRLAQKYPKLELVAIKPSEEDQKLAFQVAQDLMKAYPDLKGIFAISSVAFPGAAEAIKQAGKSGKVMVTGLSLPSDMKPYVDDGTVKSVVLWSTKDLGYLTVRTAHDLAAGKLKPSDKSVNGGRLKAKPIKGDSVILGDPIIFTKANIDKYDF
jgi:rhamnose transport system substrate-binding protein